MKVLNISHDDYANFGHDNANALRSVGVYCVDIKIRKHPFGYDNESKIVDYATMREQIKQADVVQIFHSCDELLQLCYECGQENIVVYHTGSRYRQKPEFYNQLFNPHVYKSFTDQTEFLHLGMKNPVYIATAIDTDKLIPTKEADGKLIIAHYPSSPEVKGTKEIVKMLMPYSKDFDIRIDTNIIPHAENLKRIAKCDIYIELFAPEQNGKEYGCYGVTAFEAASMGKVVVTQNIYPHVYTDAYGGCVFNYCRDETEFKKTIEFLLTSKDIRGMQKIAREIMVKNHSYKASGERLKNLLIRE